MRFRPINRRIKPVYIFSMLLILTGVSGSSVNKILSRLFFFSGTCGIVSNQSIISSMLLSRLFIGTDIRHSLSLILMAMWNVSFSSAEPMYSPITSNQGSCFSWGRPIISAAVSRFTASFFSGI